MKVKKNQTHAQKGTSSIWRTYGIVIDYPVAALPGQDLQLSAGVLQVGLHLSNGVLSVLVALNSLREKIANEDYAIEHMREQYLH